MTRIARVSPANGNRARLTGGQEFALLIKHERLQPALSLNRFGTPRQALNGFRNAISVLGNDGDGEIEDGDLEWVEIVTRDTTPWQPLDGTAPSTTNNLLTRISTEIDQVIGDEWGTPVLAAQIRDIIHRAAGCTCPQIPVTITRAGVELAHPPDPECPLHPSGIPGRTPPLKRKETHP